MIPYDVRETELLIPFDAAMPVLLPSVLVSFWYSSTDTRCGLLGVNDRPTPARRSARRRPWCSPRISMMSLNRFGLRLSASGPTAAVISSLCAGFLKGRLTSPGANSGSRLEESNSLPRTDSM